MLHNGLLCITGVTQRVPLCLSHHMQRVSIHIFLHGMIRSRPNVQLSRKVFPSGCSRISVHRSRTSPIVSSRNGPIKRLQPTRVNESMFARPVQMPTEARFSAMNSRIKEASSEVKSPDARSDAIVWFEYSGLMVEKNSDCVSVGIDIYQNNGHSRKKLLKDSNFLSGYPRPDSNWCRRIQSPA